MSIVRNSVLFSTFAAVLAASPVLAQTAEGERNWGQDQQQLMEQQSAQFSDNQISTFAEAVVGVTEVTDEYSDRFQSAETAEESTALQQEARAQMVDAIEDAGLSVQEYNDIATAARNNPNVNQAVQAELEALQQ